MLIALAWRNLWRRPSRTILSLTGMAFAAMLLVFMLSFQLGVYAEMKANALRLFDGYAQIQPKGYADDPDPRRVIDAPDKLAAEAESLPGITAAAPRASGFVILANGDQSYGGELVGIDPAREAQVTTLAHTVRQGRALRPGDGNAIVMGDALARNLKLQLGDRVTILGAAADGSVAADSLVLTGLFHSGIENLDRQVAMMPLSRFQDTFAMPGQANIIALAGPSLPQVNADLPALARLASARRLVVRNWGQLEPGLKQGIDLDFSIGMLWYASGVFVVVFIILNTLLMSVLERTHEFGMLMAIGMRANLIGRMMWIELILLALIGNAIGIVLGGAAALYFQVHGMAFGSLEGLLAQWGLPGRLYPALSWASALGGPGVILISVVLAGFVPFRRIRRLEPIEAMRAG
jgi:ABC-type lipoprotein release transport system permease subunit